MRDVNRIVLPPASFLHEKEKIEKRWPAAVEFIKERKLNEFFGPDEADVGIILQGGMYNGVMRALQQLGLADVYGKTARAALRAERHLSAGRRRGRRLLRRQDGGADGRGGPARIHRAGAQHHPAPPRHPDQDLRQGRAADGRRIHRRR